MEIYQDENLIVFEKPAGIAVLKEGNVKESFADVIIRKYSCLKKVDRCGIIHRLDKGTSGILLVAKSNKSLLFFQKQFKKRCIEKEYITLVCGRTEKKGKIETLIGRSPSDYRKQKAYSFFERKKEREALTEYEAIEWFKDYTLLKVKPKTGRKHQIRCHFAYLNHPVAGDGLYGFKNQPVPDGLTRLFLHAFSIKVRMPDKSIKRFTSDLPEDLEKVLENLRKKHGYKK